MLNEKIKMTGRLDITLNKADGRIQKTTVDNLVVTTGRAHIADQLSGQAEAAMSHMSVGTGAVAPTLADTALGAEIDRKAYDSKQQGVGADANKVIYAASWAPGEGSGAITEAGMFNSAASGVMLTRTTFAVKNKEAGDSLSIQWTLTISG